jgi:flagellar protein FliJ
MSKYRFRLETLQQVREAERNRQRARLADAYRAEEILEQQRTELKEQFEELRQQQRALVEGPSLNIDALQAAARYEPALRSQEQVLIEQQQMLTAETERRRLALVEANRDVRILELLDERGRETHRREEQRADGKELDEIANRRAWQQRNR